MLTIDLLVCDAIMWRLKYVKLRVKGKLLYQSWCGLACEILPPTVWELPSNCQSGAVSLQVNTQSSFQLYTLGLLVSLCTITCFGASKASQMVNFKL